MYLLCIYVIFTYTKQSKMSKIFDSIHGCSHHGHYVRTLRAVFVQAQRLPLKDQCMGEIADKAVCPCTFVVRGDANDYSRGLKMLTVNEAIAVHPCPETHLKERSYFTGRILASRLI